MSHIAASKSAPLASRRRPLARLGLLSALALLGGCPIQTAPLPDALTACEDGAPLSGADAVQLGLGQEGPFESLSGQRVPYFPGFQGGQHVYVTLRLFARGGRSWPADLRLVDGAGVERGRNTEYLQACPGRWSVTRYLRVFLDRPAPVRDAKITVEAAPEGGGDPPLRAQGRVEVVDP